MKCTYRGQPEVGELGELRCPQCKGRHLLGNNQRGFFHDPSADPKQWIDAPDGEITLGQATKIPLEVLQPDRDWRPFCPPPEIQTRDGWDSLACATFNTLTNIEIIIFRKYGIRENYSDRFVAWATDTYKKGGNDPQVIANFIYDIGAVDEDAWPFLPSIKSFDAYYQAPPDALMDIARDFKTKYRFNHDILKGGAAELYDSLQYCPISASVGINSVDQDGYWFKAGNGPDTHWTVFVFAEAGKYVEAFDSAEPVIKKLSWAKFKPLLMKRYTVSLQLTLVQEEQLSLIEGFLRWLFPRIPALINTPVKRRETEPTATSTPPVVEEPVKPRPSLLGPFCEAIKEHEGWGGPGSTVNGTYYPQGTRSYRNNNPGNCRYSSVGYAPLYGIVGRDEKGFAVFKSYAIGWLYLQNLVKDKIRKNPTWTLLAFFSNYAPDSDGNDSRAYALFVAKRLGVEASTFQIKNLIA